MESSKINLTEKQFSNAASTYDMNANIHRKVASYLISKANFINTNELILDIGSGTGFLSDNLKAQFKACKIVNLDISLEMLKIGKNKNPSANYIQSNMGNPPFFDSFHNIVSSMALQWLEEPKLITQTIHSILKSQGYFACSIVLLDTFSLITKLRKQVLTDESHDNISQAEKLPDFINLKMEFQNTGLALKRAEVHTFKEVYNSPDEPFSAIKNLGISGSSKRPLKKEEIFELKRLYAEHIESENISPYLDYKIGFFWGKKN